MYNHKHIEKKWQERWEKERAFEVTEDQAKKEKKQYILDMFPYPSSNGLHVGHPEGYTATDIYSRYLRMNGYHVLHPMGWDAFGLPAENFAIKQGVHPSETTEANIKNFKRQIQSLGFSYDWSREINTSSPDYYRWTQWLFLELYKKGLAYKKKAPVNWCEHCQTVLANEQVVNDECERCKNPVIQRELEQWFFKVTQYAEELLSCLDTLDWPESIKASQRNWIGKSEGANIQFIIKNVGISSASDEVPLVTVFTTRPDTLFGATYIVLAPEHALVDELKDSTNNWAAVEAYRKEAQKKNELERTHLEKEKTGVQLEGVTAINPANGAELPVWIADYVLSSYGSGAIMAVPAHDERDFEFAKKFNLPIRKVIKPEPLQTFARNADDIAAGTLTNISVESELWTNEGILVNSEEFNGMKSGDAKWAIIKKVKGERVVQYRIRDWLISRQRYWGAPIPIIYCDSCGAVPVPSADLPVLLPTDVDFKPTGESPLVRSKTFHDVACPTCGKPARRESDTMDTFVCSSWYYLRYPSASEHNEPFTAEATSYWMPVDMYVGGAEHAVLHLLYARFITKALRDLGHLSFDEPFTRLRNQGMILGEDGEKMSKSRGNVVNPDEVIELHGADTLRMYEMFMGPFEQSKPWSTGSIIGIRRFLDKTWKLCTKENRTSGEQPANSSINKLLHKTIKKVTEDITSFNFNTAISSLMILLNELQDLVQSGQSLTPKTRDTFLTLLSPFAPHIAEELWELSGHDTIIAHAQWPTYDSSLIVDAVIQLVVQINGKMRDSFEIDATLSEDQIRDLALARDMVKKWVEGKEIKKTIVIGKKLVNIVIM